VGALVHSGGGACGGGGGGGGGGGACVVRVWGWGVGGWCGGGVVRDDSGVKQLTNHLLAPSLSIPGSLLVSVSTKHGL